MTRDRWSEAFTEQARAWWTDARTRAVLGRTSLLVSPREAPVVLRAMGLLHRNATMPPDQVRKFRQINHMIGLLAPLFGDLAVDGRALRIVDAGCGRAYLTLLLAWCFRHRWGRPVELVGIERDPALVDTCRERTALAGLDDLLRFVASAIDTVDPVTIWRDTFGADPGGDVTGLDALIALHACDTATDDAIALGIASGARMIAVAPCCQAELARAWATLDADGAPGALAPIRAMPHLRRKIGADITDTMRMLMLRAAGYEAQAIEFVSSSHTARNTLIRAVWRHECVPGELVDRDAAAAYRTLRAQTGGAGLELEARLPRRVAEALVTRSS